MQVDDLPGFYISEILLENGLKSSSVQGREKLMIVSIEVESSMMLIIKEICSGPLSCFSK